MWNITLGDGRKKNKIGSLIATRENTIPGNNNQSTKILRVYLEMWKSNRSYVTYIINKNA